MSKYTEDDLKKELETKEYEYGFYTDIKSDTLPVGLSEDIVIAISKKKGEPSWMTQWRLDAYKIWKEMEEPDWANVKYKKPDFQNISYYSAPSNKPKYNSLDEVDPELLATFKKLGFDVFGASKDTVEKNTKFSDKYKLKYELGSDLTDACEKLGIWIEKSMYGKKYMGIERATFLFDDNLRLIKIWRNVKVKGHVEEVLSFIKNLD